MRSVNLGPRVRDDVARLTLVCTRHIMIVRYAVLSSYKSPSLIFNCSPQSCEEADFMHTPST
jgi:hypothetical protein